MTQGRKDGLKTMKMDISRFDLRDDDCTLAVIRALEACRETGCTELHFPQGTYRFRPEKAMDRHVFITNHDQGGTRKTAFPLLNFDDLTIDAGGSEFLFHGPMIPFFVDNSSRIKLKNMTIDWIRPMFEQGEVIEVRESSFDIRLPTGVPYEAADGRLSFEFGGRMEPVWGLHDIDPATKAHAFQSGDRISWSSFKKLRITEAGPGVMRVSGPIRHMPKIGNIITMRFGRRENPGIFLMNSTGVLIENVTLHHALGMGLVAQRCADIRLNRFDVKLRADR